DNLTASGAFRATAILPAAAPGVATAASGAGTVVDSAFIGRGVEAYAGLSVVVRTGANAGTSRQIASFDTLTGTFTLTAPFGSAFTGGEGFDIRFDLDPTVSRGGKAGAATAASGGGSLVAASTIGGGTDAYRFLELRATSGANAGTSRQITAFDSATGTFTFGTAFGAAFAAGDTWEIHAAATQMADLRGGLGIAAGAVKISDGVGGPSVTVDLSGVRDIGDLLDTLNREFAASLPALSAGLNAAGNGLEIVHGGAGTIVVEEVGGGTTAAQLGIATGPLGVAVTLTGGDLDPVLTRGTQLAQLRGGLGLDPAGLSITNGPLAATLSLTGVTRIEDLANRIAGAGVHAAAEIAADGRSLDLRQLLSGAELRVANAGGATASTLGWLHTLHRSATASLNAGAGLRTVPGADLRITTKTGATFDVDLDGATSVSGILDRINTAPGNAGLGSPILARIDELTGALVLDDRGADGGSAVSVVSTAGSFAAEGLGIASSVPNPPGVDPVLTLAGTALAPAGLADESPFTALLALQAALLSGDSDRIAAAGDRVLASRDTVLAGRADAGARSRRLELMQNRLEQDTETFRELLSNTEDIDFAEAATRLTQQQTVLQASLASAARILQTSLFEFLA
ncbi:MAG: hypothetical protein HUU15_16410, partial [Candidatus Brocadiae bacterium]|nr:hypothetical protein [Candidatus Brocadiia bacterium]